MNKVLRSYGAPPAPLQGEGVNTRKTRKVLYTYNEWRSIVVRVLNTIKRIYKSGQSNHQLIHQLPIKLFREYYVHTLRIILTWNALQRRTDERGASQTGTNTIPAFSVNSVDHSTDQSSRQAEKDTLFAACLTYFENPIYSLKNFAVEAVDRSNRLWMEVGWMFVSWDRNGH